MFRSAQIVQGAILFAAVTQQAAAYIDPGSGSLFVQFFLATAAGLVFQFRHALMKLRWWK
ncbi:MAG: hypothetical protein U0R19_20980 [Bryobacteraceae bacterium]